MRGVAEGKIENWVWEGEGLWRGRSRTGYGREEG